MWSLEYLVKYIEENKMTFDTNDVNALTYSWSICCRASYRVGFQWGRGTSFGGRGFAGSLAGETWGGNFFLFIQILSAIYVWDGFCRWDMNVNMILGWDKF